MKKLFVLLLVIQSICFTTSNLMAQATQKATQKATKEDTKEDTSIINEVLYSFGGNLNFIEKPQITGLYYDVNFFLNPIVNGSKFGLEARINQGKFITERDSSGNQLTNYFSLADPEQNDTVNVIIQNFSRVSNNLPSHISLSLTPTYSLGKDSPLFLAAHFEYIRRGNNYDYDTKVTSEIDTVFASKDISAIRLSPYKIEERGIRANIKSHDFNYATGIKFFREFQGVIVNIKTMLGYGNRDRSKGVFYLSNFEVIEKNLGFKMGGELRGIFSLKKTPLYATDFEPYVAFYLAKTFKFSKLKEVLNL